MRPLGKIFLYRKTCKQRLQVFLAPRVGLEPTTFRLTAERSTTELSRIIPAQFPAAFKTTYCSIRFAFHAFLVKPSTY